MNNQEATEFVLNKIRFVDFDSIIEPFTYENTDGEAIIIDEEGVTYHRFTYSDLSVMPDEEGFDEMFKEAICVTRDNIHLLAQWMATKCDFRICSL